MYIQCHKWFQAMFEAYKPGLVLSLNPLCQEVPLRVLKEMGGGTREIPFVTVVTDLGGAPHLVRARVTFSSVTAKQ